MATAVKRAPVFLPVLRQARGDSELDWKEGTPGTRAACPQYRPCNYIRCEFNANMVTCLDKPGRRHIDGDLPKSEPEPTRAWNNCTLDYADATAGGHEFGADEIADALGISTRQVRRIVEAARKKLAANPDAAKFLAAIAKAER